MVSHFKFKSGLLISFLKKMTQYIPTALGGNQITAGTIGAACLVAVGVCAVASVLNRLKIGIISTSIGIAATAAACFTAYYAYAYTRHTGVHTSVDNAIVNPAQLHPYIYGSAVATGLLTSYLYNGDIY